MRRECAVACAMSRVVSDAWLSPERLKGWGFRRPSGCPEADELFLAPTCGGEKHDECATDQQQAEGANEGEDRVDLGSEAEAKQTPDIHRQRRLGACKEERHGDLVHRQRETE